MTNVGPVVFIGMESSGTLRSRFQQLGYFTISCDMLPADDGSRYPEALNGVALGGHVQGDVYECLEWMRSVGLWPDFGVFHPTCTYLTCSAEWAYKDPDYVRYPDVGYHQKPKEGTLVGQARREAREQAVLDVIRIRDLPIRRKAIENPIGVLSSRIGKPQQIHQPYLHGDDASKATCTWYFDENGQPVDDMLVPVDPARRVPGRLVCCGMRLENDDRYGCPNCNGDRQPLERWGNQTNSGQNKLSGGMWKERSKTFPGVADSWVSQWKTLLQPSEHLDRLGLRPQCG